MIASPQPKRLSSGETAARIGVTSANLAKFRMNGVGPEYLKIGRRVFYEPDVVDRWIDAQRRTQTDQSRKKSEPHQATA